MDTACDAFKPITYKCSPDETGHCTEGDTDKTVKQIREHNAAWDALCG